jgi:hypothetical protein
MTFSDLCKLLYPFLKGRCKSMAELFDLLILNSMRSETEGLKQEIALMSPKQKRNLCNGVYSISHIAEKIYPFLDVTDLEEVLKQEIKGYAIGGFVETFFFYDKTIDENNFPKNISNALREILLDNSSGFRSAQLEGTATLRAELYEEDDGVCPNCGCRLDLDSSKQNAIVAISLDGLSPKDLSKTIGLCRRCAEKHRNGQIEKDLAQVKEKLEEKSALRNKAGLIDINEKLMDAIDYLLRQGGTDKIKLSMKSLRIDQKIDKRNDFALYGKVKMYVTSYFSTLYDVFGKLDGEDERSYELLSASIKIACLKAEEASQSKEAVFNSLVEQVSGAANCEKSIAEIIVSYFIQSCEVFHEIAE